MGSLFKVGRALDYRSGIVSGRSSTISSVEPFRKFDVLAAAGKNRPKADHGSGSAPDGSSLCHLPPDAPIPAPESAGLATRAASLPFEPSAFDRRFCLHAGISPRLNCSQ